MMERSRGSSIPNWLKWSLVAMHIVLALAQDPHTTVAPTAPLSHAPTVLQSSISTSSPAPQTHTIQVGLLDHKMRPEVTEAAVGDIIVFDFYPLNHSIVRAEYGFPCIPYEMTGSGKTGFFSGFNPVDQVLDSPPKWTVRINDTEPIFFYCSAPGSCITWGMVGGINLNSSMSIDRQRTLAMDSNYMLQPGEPFPAESPLPSSDPAASDSPVPSHNATSTPESAPASSGGGLSTGAIVGIVIAVVSAVLFGALLFFCWGRTRSLREAIERKDGTVRRISPGPEQMVQHTHNPSHTGFQFPAHPAVHPGSHPGSPDPAAFGHQHNGSMDGAGYFPATAGYLAKYTSPTAAHPAYHVVSPGTPPPGSLGLNGHPFTPQGAHDPARRGTPAPGYYETFPPGHQHAPERPVEMEAITTAVNQAEDTSDLNRTSKF